MPDVDSFNTKEGHTSSYDSVEFLGTTNERFNYFVGSLGRLEYRKGIGAFFDTLQKYLYTSVVTDVELQEDSEYIYITLRTLNSVYRFRARN